MSLSKSFIVSPHITLTHFLGDMETFITSKINKEAQITIKTKKVNHQEFLQQISDVLGPQHVVQTGGDAEQDHPDDLPPVPYESEVIQQKLPEVLLMITYLKIMVCPDKELCKLDKNDEDNQKNVSNIDNKSVEMYNSLLKGFIYYIQHMIEILVFSPSRQFQPKDMMVSATYYKVLSDFYNHINDKNDKKEQSACDMTSMTGFLEILLTFLKTMKNIVDTDKLNELSGLVDNNPQGFMETLGEILKDLSVVKPVSTEDLLKKCKESYEELKKLFAVAQESIDIKNELDTMIAEWDKQKKNASEKILSKYYTTRKEQVKILGIDVAEYKQATEKEPSAYDIKTCENIENKLEELKEAYNVKLQMVNFKEDLRGAVRVFIRVKPITPQPEPGIYTFPEGKAGSKSITLNRTEYGQFYNIFKPEQDNHDIFNEMKSMFDQVMNGYHVALFGYGYSGSGKTYTLLNGSSVQNQRGVLLHAINYFIAKQQSIVIHDVFELYVLDFKHLNTNPQLTGSSTQLRVKSVLDFNNEVYIHQADEDGEELKKHMNRKTELFMNVLKEINELRIKTGMIKPTINNPESSRSHLFITLKVGDGYVTVCDMGGRENPKDIFDNTDIPKNMKNIPISEIFRSDYLSTLMDFKPDFSPIQLKNFIKGKCKDDQYWNNIDNIKSLTKLLDTLTICFEGFYINETINHLTWYFNTLNGSTKNPEIHGKRSLAAYEMNKCFTMPSSNDKIHMIETLEKLNKLSSDTKPTKFVMMACVRQDTDPKFVEFNQKTLSFAKGITSASATQNQEKNKGSELHV